MKKANILNLQNEAMLLVETFSIHNTNTITFCKMLVKNNNFFFGEL